MLTFKKIKGAIPIAKVKGGKYNGKKLRIITVEDLKNQKKKEEELIDMSNLDDFLDEDDLEDFFKSIRGVNKKRGQLMGLLLKMLRQNDERAQNNIEKINEKMKKEIILNDGHLFPLPLESPRSQRIYVAGPSESGKSWWCSNYIKYYKRMYPKRRFVLFSAVGKDHVLDKFKPLRIDIDNQLMDDPIKPSELKKTIVLFDDIDGILDKKLKNTVANLRDVVLTQGRHNETTCIATNHDPCARQETKVPLREATHYVIFPRSGRGLYLYMLKKKLVLTKKEIDKIFSLPSRWVVICKTYPRHVIYDSGAYLL